ncbi:MAG: GMC family oxidoreductase [Bryobacteraceae bacterium]|nr:GMC family oxidoreductase [Bryobacteraceae bacterium]
MIDYLIIGSGPAGTAAAYALRNSGCVVMDPGISGEHTSPLDGDLFELRRSRADLFDELIGSRFEALHNIHNPPMSLKLKAPGLRFITRGQEALSPVEPGKFEATMSFAQGGLANAWGAGAYRFNEADLASFPIGTADLAPWYDEVTELIGVAGTDDDLSRWFGHTEGKLLPPVRLSSYFAGMLLAYQKRRTFMNSHGVHLGRSRLAVLTQPYRERPPYAYHNLDFFRPLNRAVYNPAFTLNELTSANLIRYERGLLALSWKEHESHIELTAKRLDSGGIETLMARHLIVAAGALNTARLALASAIDTTTRLPIMDNPMSCIPLVRLSRIGAGRDPLDSPLGQLNMVYEGPDSTETLQATLYGTAGPMRSDLAMQFPLSLRANLACARYLTPAIGFVLLFYPDAPDAGNYLQLLDSGALRIVHRQAHRGQVERGLIRAFRKLGYLSSFRLCQFPSIGAGIHYAGCLPMKADPGPYETRPDGSLYGFRRVYVVDGAVFPRLPAKNLTLTIMANAMRVASQLRARP